MTESIIVEKNFSRDPDYYHQHAETQHYIADKLAGMLQSQDVCKIQKILEIGCGTGFLTKKLLSLFPCAEFTITDISKSMLRFCEHQTQTLRSEQNIVASFAINNILTSCPEGEFDLIISSLAFQWIDDLPALLQQLNNRLSSNGILIFSTLSQGTFSSVKKIFSDLDVLFSGPALLTSREIKSACGNFSKVKIADELCIEEFNSILEFLRHIQGTGAGNASGKSQTVPNLKKILKHTGKLPAEYNVIYAVCFR